MNIRNEIRADVVNAMSPSDLEVSWGALANRKEEFIYELYQPHLLEKESPLA